MKLLWALCAVWGARAAAAAAAAETMPACGERGACAAAPPRRQPGGWSTGYYVVDGKRLAVEWRRRELRWRCARGLAPAAPPAPRLSSRHQVDSLELIDCKISHTSYDSLLLSLSVETDKLSLAFTTARYRNERWPSMDELKLFKKNQLSTDSKPPISSLRHLSLCGIPMTVDQLASVRHIETLRLEETGLEEVMDLSEFVQLQRLELLEPGLRDAVRLATAPALAELVLRAPDAALAPLTRLRRATFMDVYAMESIFGDCGRLEELAVEGGELAEVRERWLAGCVRLQRLRLTRLRRLHALPGGLQADAAALETLDLSHNALEALPADLLAGAARLSLLDLSGNALLALPAHLFRDTASLVLVFLRDNPKLAHPEVPRRLQEIDSCYYSPNNVTLIDFCDPDGKRYLLSEYYH